MTRQRYRVLHLLPDLTRGGGQGVVLELVTHADPDRFEIFLAWLQPPDDMAPAFEAAGADLIRMTHGGDGIVAAALELSRHLRHHAIDIVHVHSDPDRKVGQLAALLTRTMVIGHLHSPWAHLDPMHAAGVAGWRRGLSTSKARLRRALEGATVQHYLAAGDEVAGFHDGRLDAPVTVVRNGIDTEVFGPRDPFRHRARRRALGLTTEQHLLMCVGRLAVGKGQDELIRVLRDVPEAVLALVGGGEEHQALAALAREVGVVDRVLFLGDRDDVPALLATADVFTFASLSEGLPLSVLEGMAAQLPVVAYSLPGLRGVITDGVDGCLVPLGDRGAMAAAIRELLGADARRHAMGQAARATVVERFDSQVMTGAVEQVYMRVLRDEEVETEDNDGCRLVLG